jgi:hypothetical protein
MYFVIPTAIITYKPALVPFELGVVAGNTILAIKFCIRDVLRNFKSKKHNEIVSRQTL